MTSHAKLFSILGSQTHQLSSDNLEVKSTPKNISPSYIVLYVFNGTFQRGGIGHIAMWDGASYYSYGQGNGEPWIESNFSLAKSNARAILDYKIWKYGPYKKIILPSNLYLSENYDAIRSNINVNWKSNAYSLTNKNCAHMVQDYLVQARYTIPIHDCFQFPLYPSEVANNAKNIGKAVADNILHGITTQFDTTAYQMQLYKDYLVLLKGMMAAHPMLNKLQIKELHEAMQDGKADQEKFCRVFAIIARHHYDDSLFAYKINECDKFYESMFVEALQICAHRPKFENEPQVHKTGLLRHPIAITRAVVGALLLPVLVIIAFVPICLYKLYIFLTKKPSSKTTIPPDVVSSTSASTIVNIKPSSDSTRSINYSINGSIQPLSSIVTEDTPLLPRENKELYNKRDHITFEDSHQSTCRII